MKNTFDIKDIKIGIWGAGFVGQAIYDAYSHRIKNIWRYDINPNLRDCNEVTLVENCNIIIVTVPTNNDDNGRQDPSHVIDSVSTITRNVQKINDGIERTIVLRSTVTPGTTRTLKVITDQASNLEILFSPEFLSRGTAVQDVKCPSRTMIGTHNGVLTPAAKRYRGLVVYIDTRAVYDMNDIIVSSYESAELSKYMCNCMGAVKVSFMNELYQYSKEIGLSPKEWDAARECMLRSGWVAEMHTHVPGPDGHLGYGGPCLPKDTIALATEMLNKDLSAWVTHGAVMTNADVREDAEE